MLTDIDILQSCKDYTMTSYERQIQTLKSIEHIINNNIEGDIIEIGVWRGGIVMIMLKKLLQLGITNRTIHLYDTFTGMTEASDKDIDPYGNFASNIMHDVKCYASFTDVYDNILSVGYPMNNIKFHKGDIRNTNLSNIPSNIALLRLDNDFYQLYKFELPVFEPSVSKNGVITIDDYGYWSGCRLAIDEYIFGKNITLLPIDGNGVYWFKN